MKKSVGLVVMVKMPQEDGSEILMAVLQRRGTFNTEKMKPESYPGCCQVTCHGEVEGYDEGVHGEFYNALIRESREELGSTFTMECQKYVPLVELICHQSEEKKVVTYGVLVTTDRLKMIRLGPDSGGLDYVREDEISGATTVLVEIKPEYKVSGPPTGVRALFPDEIHAIEKAFEVFGKK